jgi:hypothetical protein
MLMGTFPPKAWRLGMIHASSPNLGKSDVLRSSPRKPNGLSHGIFECLIVEASSHAQNYLGVLADRHTQRCRGVFDCTGDG